MERVLFRTPLVAPIVDAFVYGIPKRRDSRGRDRLYWSLARRRPICFGYARLHVGQAIYRKTPNPIRWESLRWRDTGGVVVFVPYRRISYLAGRQHENNRVLSRRRPKRHELSLAGRLPKSFDKLPENGKPPFKTRLRDPTIPDSKFLLRLKKKGVRRWATK